MKKNANGDHEICVNCGQSIAFCFSLSHKKSLNVQLYIVFPLVNN